MATVIAELQAKLTLDNSEFLTGLKQSSKAVDTFSKKIEGVNTQLVKMAKLNLSHSKDFSSDIVNITTNVVKLTKSSSSLATAVSGIDSTPVEKFNQDTLQTSLSVGQLTADVVHFSRLQKVLAKDIKQSPTTTVPYPLSSSSTVVDFAQNNEDLTSYAILLDEVGDSAEDFAEGAGEATAKITIFRVALGQFVKLLPGIGAVVTIIGTAIAGVAYAAKSAKRYLDSSTEAQDKMLSNTTAVTAWANAWGDLSLYFGEFFFSFQEFGAFFKNILGNNILKAMGLGEYVDEVKEAVDAQIWLNTEFQKTLTLIQGLQFKANDSLYIVTDESKSYEDRTKALTDWLVASQNVIREEAKSIQANIDILESKSILGRKEQDTLEELKRKLVANTRQYTLLAREAAEYTKVIQSDNATEPVDKIPLNNYTPNIGLTGITASIDTALDLQAKRFNNARIAMSGVVKEIWKLGEAYNSLDQEMIATNEDAKDSTDSMYNYAQSLSTVSMNLVNAGVALADSMQSGDNTLASLGNFISQIASFMIEFGVLLVAFGVAEEALYAGDVYTKIAAGVALAGLAIAIAGSLSNISSSGGGGSTASRGSYGGSYGGGLGYDYNREIVMVARGEDLVGVINRQNYKNGING